MYKIAAIGDYDSIFGFAALGFEIYPVTDASGAEKIMRKLESECAVIYITEKLASEIHDEIERLKEQFAPAVILIPGVSGNTGEGMSAVRKSVEQAVGSDII